MTHHLTAENCVDVLEDRPSSAVTLHLETCEACRKRVAGIRAVAADVRSSGDMPEPSPLFWQHFSDRVRVATADLQPARASWWQTGLRPIAAMLAVAGALLLGVMLRQPALRPAGYAVSSDLQVAASSAGVVDEPSLNFVAEVVSTMPYDELQQVTRPTPDATDALVAQLTQAQRAELVRLIRAEGSGGE